VHSLLDDPTTPVVLQAREFFAQTLAAEETTYYGLPYRWLEVLRTYLRTSGHIQYGLERRSDPESVPLFHVSHREIPFVQNHSSWRILSETSGHAQVHLLRHQVGEAIEPERRLMGDDCLRVAFPVAAPKVQAYEILVFSLRIPIEPE
jgi:hypothetical protein